MYLGYEEGSSFSIQPFTFNPARKRITTTLHFVIAILDHAGIRKLTGSQEGTPSRCIIPPGGRLLFSLNRTVSPYRTAPRLTEHLGLDLPHPFTGCAYFQAIYGLQMQAYLRASLP